MRIMFILTVYALCSVTANAETTNCIAEIRREVGAVNALCLSNKWDYWTIEEALNFEWFRTNAEYRSFANAISCNWQSVLQCLDAVATNGMERLLVLGVGKQYGEDFYMDYIGELSDMRTNSLITANEFEWARASTRYELMSCLIRRYREPKVMGLLEKLKVSIPQNTDEWNKIISGEAYTNYLEEVSAGLWQ